MMYLGECWLDTCGNEFIQKTEIHQVDNNDAGDSFEREHLIGATDPVLGSSDVLFNFW